MDFPSYHFTNRRPSREMELVPDWSTITDEYEFEDGRKDFNEVADSAPIRWEYEVIVNAESASAAKTIADEYRTFYNTVRHSQPFDFTDKFGTVWSDVRVESCEINHDAHRSWTVFVSFVLVSFTGENEEPEESNDLLTNLVAYWKLDEASGNAIDAHASNDLTDNNSVGSASGKVGNARDFEADSNEYLSIADNADLSTGDIDFTFAYWINMESKGAFRAFIGKDEDGQREYLGFYNTSVDRLAFSVFTPTEVSAVANNLGSPSTATWYFVVMWHDATANTVNIQVNNGTADSTATGGALSASGTASFYLGGRSYTASLLPYDGLIDEVGFWKRLLTTDEKTFLYNGGAGRTYEDFD